MNETATPNCFHCSELLPSGEKLYASLSDEQHLVCCLGCKAIVEFIDGNELSAFYEHRSPPHSTLDLKPEASAFEIYDSAELLSRYVHKGTKFAETTVDIGGMYCAACAWLLDRALTRDAAVNSVDVNPATRRAVIRWDIAELPFSRLLETIANVGFKPQPIGQDQHDSAQGQEYRQALKRLIVAAAAGMQVMMFAVALYAGDFFGIEPSVQKFLRAISLIVTLPILFYSATPFMRGAWRGLIARMPGMDLPISIAILAAFAASVRAIWIGEGDIYFDSVAMFVGFLSATRFLEMRSRHRSDTQALALRRLLPDTAIRYRNGASETVTVDQIQVGDVVIIKPGDVIPADGELVFGKLSVDESMLTGESLPVTRTVGMSILAGSSNQNGAGRLRVSKTGASTSLAEIGRLLERAKADRPPIALLADRIASYFVLAVLLLAATTGLVWSQLDTTRVFEVVLATLVVTCPCALALATPAALAAATSRLAAGGFLLVRSRILEVLRPGATIVFDKTGTLTSGRPVILQTRLLSDTPEYDEKECRRLAALLEANSEHVLARAFTPETALSESAVSDISTEAGGGIGATIGGVAYRIGNINYVQEIAGPTTSVTPAEHLTRVYLGSSAGFLAEFHIGDQLRSDAQETVRQLQFAGFHTVIASGDQPAVVSRVAQMLGIEDWHASLTPQGKLEFMQQRRLSGDTVIMVGDGINDAPVLAAADASIALDAGTALARASADAIVLGKGLTTLLEAVRLASQTRQVIRQNIIWAIGYNTLAVPLAAAGFLAPWMAALGMSASSIIVVLNALRLHRRSPRQGSATSLANNAEHSALVTS